MSSGITNGLLLNSLIIRWSDHKPQYSWNLYGLTHNLFVMNPNVSMAAT